MKIPLSPILNKCICFSPVNLSLSVIFRPSRGPLWGWRNLFPPLCYSYKFLCNSFLSEPLLFQKKKREKKRKLSFLSLLLILLLLFHHLFCSCYIHTHFFYIPLLHWPDSLICPVESWFLTIVLEVLCVSKGSHVINYQVVLGISNVF